MNKKFMVKGIFSSGMVLQQNKINCAFGIAEPYDDVILTFREITTITQADEEGNWKLEFSPGRAGGPFTMVIKTEKERVEYTDVYVGEVWVNSGQSNAQLPMERMKFSYADEFKLPANPNIRMITVPISWTYKGEKDYVENPQWIGASPENLGEMSGTGYFFAKKLSEELNVPVGIINASQGGSPISSWISKKALEEMNQTEYLEKLAYFENDQNIASKQKELIENQKNWESELFANVHEYDKDSDFFASVTGWEKVSIPGDIPVESAGFIWIRKTIELSDEQVQIFNNQKTWLWMGTIVDADQAFVNGVKVGETPYCYPPRRYVVPSGTLKTGKNVIAMRVQKNAKAGCIRFYKEKPYFLFTDNVFVKPVATRNVEIQNDRFFPLDGEQIDLSGEWEMKVDVQVRDCPPGMFFEWQPTALYNAMLAPCFNHAVAGALWYQGESDTGHPAEYKNMLVKMINVWRRKFVYGSKNLPFVVMQLPNWADGFEESSTINNMDWCYMRQAQADGADAAGNTGVAVTIDAGEWNDLHPEKKKTGGTRAALEALRVAYGRNFISPSPRMKKISEKRNKYVVEFDCGNSSLVSHMVTENSADLEKESKHKEVFGFSFLFNKKEQYSVVEASAKLISDYEVEVSLPKGCGDAVELRYLWADCPKVVNLYSRDLLPAMPFMVKLV